LFAYFFWFFFFFFFFFFFHLDFHFGQALVLGTLRVVVVCPGGAAPPPPSSSPPQSVEPSDIQTRSDADGDDTAPPASSLITAAAATSAAHDSDRTPTVDELVRICRDAAPLLLLLPPREPASRAVFRAVIMLFPDVPVARAHELIDAAQLQLKPEFVERGLMIGEFHAGNDTAGLHSSAFFPLRCPVPALAVRSLVRSDAVFMDTDEQRRAHRLRFPEAQG
jgi:hypothetical protein